MNPSGLPAMPGNWSHINSKWRDLMKPMENEAIRLAFEEIDSGWQLDDGKLHREFIFPDFVEAFGFMTRAAIRAEKMNHHPEWSNVYKKVEVYLVTHEAGGITERDFELARIMDSLA
jgi:4a-hydroxytetrahydrobiopterin dehydratase